MVEKIFVREYLESLKEDTELDFIFVLLLEAMGLKIVTTPKEYKGQPQYGKDIIATGPASDGIDYKWYFELKGHADRDINQSNFLKDDGARMSLLEAKDTDFVNHAIPGFNQLTVKYVLVHNGVVKGNFRPTFDGFVSKNFALNQFEHWDIHALTNLFAEHLFGEYLLTDQNSVRLFKRVLVFLSVPEYQFEDVDLLADHLVSQYKSKPGKRNLQKLMVTFNLLAMLLWHYAKENNNLHPAKIAIPKLVLKCWVFILSSGAERDRTYTARFEKLANIYLYFLQDYFLKTMPFANTKKGLFSVLNSTFEPLGQRLRSFEYLDDLIFFYLLAEKVAPETTAIHGNQVKDKALIKELIKNNYDAFTNPVLDSHLIPIVHLFGYFFHCHDFDQNDYEFLSEYLVGCVDNIIIRKQIKNVWPHAGADPAPLIEFEASGIKSNRYQDSSSLLITVLMELTAIFNLKTLYDQVRGFVSNEINLQIAYPLPGQDETLENMLFSKHMDDEYYVETHIVLPENFEVFKENLLAKPRSAHALRTIQVNYGFLIILAQSHYRNEPFPYEWRGFIDRLNFM